MDRRRLLAALGSVAASSILQPAGARAQGAVGTPPWPLDLDGSGVVDALDRTLLAGAATRARGDGLRPRDGWDPRLDFEARGRLGRDRLARFDAAAGALPIRLPPRPIVTCWHYGWYGPGRRRAEETTVRYLGGAYLSRDRRVEERFNELKREFGIDADLLSWTRERAWLQPFERGYLAARNRRRRRFGLLYESNISLGTTARIDFAPDAGAADRVVDDFAAMGAWLAAHDGARLLRIDRRPVVYLFGSHTFGTTRETLPHVGRALVRARAAFATSFGSPPWLIGDEALFPGDAEAGYARRYRATFFDAIGRYHHYDAAEIGRLGEGRSVRLDAAHRRRLVALERRTIEAFADVRCRFTGRPVRVIPSAAAGFAKRGLPRLLASGSDYEAFLHGMQAVTAAESARLRSGRSDPALPEIVNVGSWNEEFEGHALLPAASNRALLEPRAQGFDWLRAVKAVYGSAHPLSPE